jgi:hypothetical protein
MPTSQGYYVVTPFRVQKRKDQGDGGEEVEEIWLVNRGWVPRSLVVGGDNSKAGLAAERQATKPTAATAATNYHREPRRLDWYRPTGPAQVLRAVPAVLESTYGRAFDKTRPLSFSAMTLHLFLVDLSLSLSL